MAITSRLAVPASLHTAKICGIPFAWGFQVSDGQHTEYISVPASDYPYQEGAQREAERRYTENPANSGR